MERSSSKERVNPSSSPLDCSWDTTNLIRPNIKPLRDSVHLLVSPIILGYFESSMDHTTFKGGERSDISGLESALVISLSQSLEVTSAKSYFFWGLSIYNQLESPFSISDSISSLETTSCIEASCAK